jgi:diguanylate cyclase
MDGVLMKKDRLGTWLTSTFRVALAAVLGTAFCVLIAIVYDSYSLTTGQWEWGPRPWNNVLIPLVLAPPLLYLLLSKLRALSIAQHRLEIVASTDGLTSCLNRAAFSTLVDAYLDEFRDHKELRHGAILLIDVDNFKMVNDSYGHGAGDDALQMIAAAIKRNLRDGDLVGRLGGEEFSVFLPRLSPSQGGQVAERIRVSVEQLQFAPQEKQHPLSVSIGGVSLEVESNFSSLYRAADQRLYEAKRAGRNRVAMATEDTVSIH